VEKSRTNSLKKPIFFYDSRILTLFSVFVCVSGDLSKVVNELVTAMADEEDDKALNNNNVTHDNYKK
jgi:hypothetical protein